MVSEEVLGIFKEELELKIEAVINHKNNTVVKGYSMESLKCLLSEHNTLTWSGFKLEATDEESLSMRANISGARGFLDLLVWGVKYHNVVLYPTLVGGSVRAHNCEKLHATDVTQINEYLQIKMGLMSS